MVTIDIYDLGSLVMKSNGVGTASRSKTKYQVASDTLLEDIESGKLRPGDRLPSEEQLVTQLGFSLGTIQRALRDLAQQGVVQRVHGSGTYVSGARTPEDHLRHFRFRAEGDDSLLAIYFETKTLERTDAKGEWSAFLGDDKEGFVKIERLVNVNSEFDLFSELYLPMSRYAMLLDIQASELDGVSIRDLSADTFNMPTVHTEQFISCAPFPPRVSRMIDAPMAMFGMVLTIKSFGYRQTPTIWQRAFVPPSDRKLELAMEAPK